KLKVAEKQKLEEQRKKNQAEIDRIDAEIRLAEQNAGSRAAEIRGIERELDRLGGRVELLDIRRRFKKADLDSKRSLYDGMIDKGEEHAARVYLTSVVAGAERELETLSKGLEAAQKELNDKKAQKEVLLG